MLPGSTPPAQQPVPPPPPAAINIEHNESPEYTDDEVESGESTDYQASAQIGGQPEGDEPPPGAIVLRDVVMGVAIAIIRRKLND